MNTTGLHIRRVAEVLVYRVFPIVRSSLNSSTVFKTPRPVWHVAAIPAGRSVTPTRWAGVCSSSGAQLALRNPVFVYRHLALAVVAPRLPHVVARVLAQRPSGAALTAAGWVSHITHPTTRRHAKYGTQIASRAIQYPSARTTPDTHVRVAISTIKSLISAPPSPSAHPACAPGSHTAT
jgi:hypothetical protein